MSSEVQCTFCLTSIEREGPREYGWRYHADDGWACSDCAKEIEENSTNTLAYAAKVCEKEGHVFVQHDSGLPGWESCDRCGLLQIDGLIPHFDP